MRNMPRTDFPTVIYLTANYCGSNPYKCNKFASILLFKQNLSKGGIPRRGKAPMYPTERKRSLNTKDAVNKMPRTGFEPISSVPKTGTLAS